jgi:hypothetical protein
VKFQLLVDDLTGLFGNPHGQEPRGFEYLLPRLKLVDTFIKTGLVRTYFQRFTSLGPVVSGLSKSASSFVHARLSFAARTSNVASCVDRYSALKVLSISFMKSSCMWIRDHMFNTWTMRSLTSVPAALKLLHAFTKTLPYLKEAPSAMSLSAAI